METITIFFPRKESKLIMEGSDVRTTSFKLIDNNISLYDATFDYVTNQFCKRCVHINWGSPGEVFNLPDTLEITPNFSWATSYKCPACCKYVQQILLLIDMFIGSNLNSL